MKTSSEQGPDLPGPKAVVTPRGPRSPCTRTNRSTLVLPLLAFGLLRLCTNIPDLATSAFSYPYDLSPSHPRSRDRRPADSRPLLTRAATLVAVVYEPRFEKVSGQNKHSERSHKVLHNTQ